MSVIILKGFAATTSLIVAIGAQNAFVIRQGILQRHLLITALVCSMIDAVLILLGVLGFGRILSLFPQVIEVSKCFAFVFLIFYGIVLLKSLKNAKGLGSSDQIGFHSAKKTVLYLMALSFLNPHVYLDTVILLGSIASQHPLDEKIYFSFGAISASFIWFFAITYGSCLLAPVLSKPSAWIIINVCIALMMWVIAISIMTSFSW